MIEGLVTIVVPVYNVERYLDRCLKSITEQTYRNLEILLIDDKSPDKSSEKCDKWAEDDRRIRVIHKSTNEGLGEARNTGIDNARGEYICFFDSDDYIEKNTIEVTYRIAKEACADIVHFGFKLMDRALKLKMEVNTESDQKFSGEEIKNIFIPNMIAPDPKTGKGIGLWMSLCSGLFSMKVIDKNKWRCESERRIISEDMYSLLKFYSYINTAIVIDQTFYCYCENSGSLTHSYREDRFDRIKEFYIACLKLCKECGYNPEIAYRVSGPFIDYTIAALKQIVAKDMDKSEKIEKIKKIYDDDILRDVLVQNKHVKRKLSKRFFLWTIKHKYYHLGYICLRLRGQ